ncbi:MAG: DHH family phosphoesterase [Methanomassiliicoccales archaeon]|nr:DHH family phosphoesterase [Methanomassiliicoccales archaeon]
MIEDIIGRLSSDKLILVHGNADPDALGSAYALAKAFPPAVIFPVEGLDRTSKNVSARLGMELLTRVERSYPLIVVLDTSSPEQLGIFSQMQGDMIIIDHHCPSTKWEGRGTYLCDDSKRSCAELVLEIIQKAGRPITRDMAMALCAGILTDTGHFRFSNPGSLRAFASLIEGSNLSMEEVLAITESPVDISERVAQMKGGQRLRFERVGEYIVAVSQGSSFESSVCKALLNLGADIAFVASQRNQEFRLSARARQDLVRKGLHLGQLLGDVGEETDNDGGGHGGAAGLVGVGDAEAILNICLQKSMAYLRTLR